MSTIDSLCCMDFDLEILSYCKGQIQPVAPVRDRLWVGRVYHYTSHVHPLLLHPCPNVRYGLALLNSSQIQKKRHLSLAGLNLHPTAGEGRSTPLPVTAGGSVAVVPPVGKSESASVSGVLLIGPNPFPAFMKLHPSIENHKYRRRYIILVYGAHSRPIFPSVACPVFGARWAIGLLAYSA